jgi:hypothetical protein
LSLKIEEVQIEIMNYSSHYLFERKLNLTMSDLSFTTKRPGGDEKDDFPNSEVKKLETLYLATSLRIGRFDLTESYKIGGMNFSIAIISTKVIACIYDCIYPNHPLHTDKKVHLLVPYLRLHLDDHYILLSEVIQIITSLSNQSHDQQILKSMPPNKQAFITMGKNQSNNFS